MTNAEPHEPAENRLYQERLAAALVDCLGVEGAVRACQANGWDGVLSCLSPEPKRPDGEPS
jgi:hypothetical protein